MRKGGTELVDVMLFRREGFDGEVQVVADGLPEGVTSAPVTIAAGQERGVLVLSAAENAAESMSLITILGKAKIGEADVTRPARPAAMIWGGRANQIAPLSPGAQLCHRGQRRRDRGLLHRCRGEQGRRNVQGGQGRGADQARAPRRLQRRRATGRPPRCRRTSSPPPSRSPRTRPRASWKSPCRPTCPRGATRSPWWAARRSATSRSRALKVVTDRKTAVDKIVTELAAAAKAATEAKAAAEKRAADMTVAIKSARGCPGCQQGRRGSRRQGQGRRRGESRRRQGGR